ncbi:MAG: PH domain-containing protein [Flavobacteriaceae bacterium]
MDSLPKYQEVPFQFIHPKYWNVMAINISIFIVFLLLGFGVLSFIIPEVMPIWFYVLIPLFILLFGGFLLWINRIAFKKRGYALREKDLLYRSGILATTTTIVPFNRIQHIAVNEGVFSRMYGLAALEIYTAGGNSSDLTVSGIEREKAISIKEFLMNNINFTSDSMPKDEENTPTPEL